MENSREVGTPIPLTYGENRVAPNLIWYGDFRAKAVSSTIQAVINLLNSRPDLPTVQRFMLMARVQRAAKLGDVNAQRFVTLCELDISTSTRN
jgi:hypothetical protein